MGKLLIVVGLAIAAVGALMHFGLPLGRLPGDVIVRRGNVTFSFPIVTSLILSLVITLLVALFRR
jgi:di/tricarboxylate transporter